MSLVSSTLSEVRWLVGSSSTRKFGGSSSIRAITSRVFSPPDSARIFLSTSSPENWNAPARLRSAPIDSCGKSFCELLLDRQVRIEQVERLLREVAHLQARAELHRRRRRARSAPATIFSSVVLPAPFLPITHQRSPRRIVRLRPS